jgi:outer membrane lipoprotein-sorting protein
LRGRSGPTARTCGRPGRILRVAAAAFWLAFAAEVPFAVGAQPPEVPVSGPERSLWFEKTRERQKDVDGLRASVVQRKRHPSLKGELVSEGMLLYRKPALLRWEIVRPESMILVMDGSKLTVYHPSRKEAERKYLSDSMATRAAVEFLTVGMAPSLQELERRFRVELLRGEGYFVLKLFPRGKWLSRAVSSISVYHGEGGIAPRRVVVEGAGGERTETSLTRVVANPAFPPDAFDLRLGPGVNVIEEGGIGKVREDAP